MTTKLWVEDAGYEKTKKAFDRSMKRLGLDVLDLFLIHQPFGDVFGSWRAMQELYREGRIRAIGVSNFHADRVMDFIVHNEIVPAVNQIETHPFHQQIERQPVLARQRRPARVLGPFAEGKNDIFKNELLATIGARHGKSIAQVIVRWLVQRGIVAIPKAVRKERMVENLAVFDFELGAEEIQAIVALDSKTSSFFGQRDPKMVKAISGRTGVT